MAEVAILVGHRPGRHHAPRAIPLAMSTENFYAWFSSVSPISIGIGLRAIYRQIEKSELTNQILGF